MAQYIPEKSALKLFSRSIAQRYKAVPMELLENSLRVLFAASPSANDLSDLIFYTGLAVEVEVATSGEVGRLIDTYYPERAGEDETQLASIQYEHRSESPAADTCQGPIVERVNSLVSSAAAMDASDIHLEPGDTDLSVRYRIDGVLQEMPPVASDERSAVISRIKLMAGMDIAERRRPQDGRITMRCLDDLLDVRVSSVPTRNSEKLVLRLLNKSDKLKNLAQLGMTDTGLAVFRKYLDRPQGMILVSGPTGSGKSTTLYAALSYLARPGVNIMTIEDPIEYEVAGITQSQAKPEINYDFSTALRAFLRQDPDIIMVGEIRDQETAQIALRAAMTGHLVLSTVHTNDAASTITRLIDIGVEPYLVASSVSLVIAQRLMRLYCENCRGTGRAQDPGDKREPSNSASKRLSSTDDPCKFCNGSGYRGRIGVFEVLEIDDRIRAAIQNRCPAQQIEQIANERGVRPLSESARRLVSEERTSEHEYRRVMSS